MFLQEIGTDVTIEASNRKMKAHKCILRSRCQYFAAILGEFTDKTLFYFFFFDISTRLMFRLISLTRLYNSLSHYVIQFFFSFHSFLFLVKLKFFSFFVFLIVKAGNWVSHSGNVISLHGYSYSAVHFGKKKRRL
jgi:hypothetical protein